jgi:hypothetical protein
MASGCASNWKSRSVTHATIYAETTEIPVLFADSTFVGAVDGTNTERGKGLRPGRAGVQKPHDLSGELSTSDHRCVLLEVGFKARN